MEGGREYLACTFAGARLSHALMQCNFIARCLCRVSVTLLPRSHQSDDRTSLFPFCKTGKGGESGQGLLFSFLTTITSNV
jgi:hypothetical protein